MTRYPFVKRIAVGSTFVLMLGLTQAAVAADAATVVSAATDPCVEVAQDSAEGNWMCVGDILTDKHADGQAVVVDVNDGSSVEVKNAKRLTRKEKSAIKRFTVGAHSVKGSGRQYGTRAVVDDYHANKSTTLYYGSGSIIYGNIKFEHRVALYNHSAADKQNITFSQPGGDLYWTLRIRRDNNLGGDDTVFTYPDRQDCQATGVTCSKTEDRYGDGYNRFPYDGKKYFLDAYNWNLYIGGNNFVNLGGSAQSDRATCYKTTNCKFKG